MLLKRGNHQRLFSLLAATLTQNSPASQPFVFASAFSSASSCVHVPDSSSLSASKTMMPDNTSGKNVVRLSFLEATVSTKSSSPPTLLVHGLDSSSHTWKGLLDDLAATGCGAVAVDQRGCGKSPLGPPDEFSPDALVDDLYELLSSHPLFRGSNSESDSVGVKPFVLVGHSMGGRVAMSFAARHPESVAALVIEDMDVRTRSLSESRIRSEDREATLAFDRNLKGISTPEDVVEAFEAEGYPTSQVEKWLSEGRVAPAANDENRYYSQVNPAFRLLCYEQFFETNHGQDTWEKLSAIPVATDRNFPIHLMIADPTMTVCNEDSVSVMKHAMESSSSSSPLTIHRYPGATHSIHNSVAEDFFKDLKVIIEGARTRK